MPLHPVHRASPAFALLFVPLLAGAQAPAATDPALSVAALTRVLDLTALGGIEDLLTTLASRRVVFIGEQHDRYEHHLAQLAIIQGLHARGKPLAIGLECFQQPFQTHLDDYVAGRINEATLLARTGYFERWGYDYRLYRPILRFAREQGIPLIALNLEEELTRRVGEVGIAGLTPAERARIPDALDPGDPAYRARLEAVFQMHPATQRRNLEQFIEVQMVWDEGMAERAARALQEHPDRALVVLAGSGHLEYGQGIPRRLQRRAAVPSAIVLDGGQRPPDAALADHLLYPPPVELPPTGRLGVRLAADGPAGGGARVEGFAEPGGAQAAGLRAGDRIVRIGTQPVAGYSDVRIALLDTRPGARVPVEVLRVLGPGVEERRRFEVTLR